MGILSDIYDKTRLSQIERENAIKEGTATDSKEVVKKKDAIKTKENK